MTSLTLDVLEHVMSFLEQDDRVACTQVSKNFCKAFQTPRIWTNVHLQSLGPQAKAFVNSCTHLTTLKITAKDLESLDAFLSGIVYPDTITDLSVMLCADTPGPLFIEKLTDAFRHLTSLNLEIVESRMPVIIVVPEIVLTSFRFWDRCMMTHLVFHADFKSDISSIQADSVSDFGGPADVYCVNSSSIAHIQSSEIPRSRKLVIDMDDEFALDFQVDAEEIVLKTNGYDAFIDVSPLRISQCPLKRLIIDGPEETVVGSVVFTPISVDEFFDTFYSPHQLIELRISNGCKLEVWPM